MNLEAAIAYKLANAYRDAFKREVGDGDDQA